LEKIRNGKQNSGLANSVPDSRLPFAQINPIYRKMTEKPETGIKGGFKDVRLEHSDRENRITF